MPRFRFLLRRFGLGALALLLSACGSGDAPDRSEAYERALALLEQGRPAEAWPVIEAEAQRRPDDPATLALLIRVARPLSRYPKADAAAQHALEIAPRDPDVLLATARLAEDLGLLGDAVTRARTATEVAPDRVEAHVLLGELLLQSAQPDGAALAYRRAVELAPDDLLLLGSLGRALVMAGEHEEGRIALDRYLTEQPLDAEARVQRGVARLRERDFPGAEEDFRVAIRVAPYKPSPYHNLAMVLQRTGREEEAARMRERHREVNDLDWEIRGVQRRLKTEPRNAELRGQLVELLRRAGRDLEADELERRP